MATSTTALLKRFSFPKVPGDQPWSIIDVTGPASYVQVTPGNPPTGGQRVNAQDFGLQALDFVAAMASTSGQLFVNVIPLGVGEYNSVLLQWMMSGATPEEAPAAGNLSTTTVRLLAIGR